DSDIAIRERESPAYLRGFLKILPIGNMTGRLEHFPALNIAHAVFALPRWCIAVLEGVANSEIKRIDLQCPGDHIHLRFSGKHELHHSRRTEMAARNRVGIDRIGVDLNIWDPIGTGCFDGTR